jgi:hypothetical protein
VTISVRAQARVAGLLYVVVIATGLFAEAFVRERLVDDADAAVTASRIVAAAGWYRAGFIADIVNLLAGLPVIAILYGLFRPAGPVLARTALLFVIVANAVLAVVEICHFLPLQLLGGAPYLAPLSAGQLQALSLLALKVHALGYSISLAFFAFWLILIGVLILRSALVPRGLGMLVAIAGACYLVNSVVNFLPPDVAPFLFPYVLMPSFIGESAFALWLLVVGIDPKMWSNLAAEERRWTP